MMMSVQTESLVSCKSHTLGCTHLARRAGRRRCCRRLESLRLFRAATGHQRDRKRRRVASPGSGPTTQVQRETVRVPAMQKHQQGCRRRRVASRDLVQLHRCRGRDGQVAGRARNTHKNHKTRRVASQDQVGNAQDQWSRCQPGTECQQFVCSNQAGTFSG